MIQPDTHNTNAAGFEPVSGETDPLIPFDVREQNGRRGLYILLGAIIALLVIATVLFLTYQPGTRDRDATPRIKADNQPFKVEPENPGGAQTPDQDKSVYDVMAGKAVEEDVVATPGSEVPIEMPKTANIQVQAPKAVTPKMDSPKPVAVAPVITKPAPKPAARPQASAPVTTGSGTSVVQIASVRSRGAAEDIWANVSSNHSDLFVSGLYSDIVNVDLGDKGIYYRLRIAGLSDKASAKRLCDQLKARDQACLVTKR
jgi:cell division septation protein DedD